MKRLLLAHFETPVLSLVKNSDEWPGVLLYQPGNYRCPRPSVFFRDDGPTDPVLSLEISALPIAGHAQRIHQTLRLEVKEREKALRREFREEGRRFLGAERICKQDPFDRPANHEPRRGMSPRVASRDKWRRVECLLRDKDFLRRYRDAAQAYADGDHTAVFPLGTYQMRHRCNVRCADENRRFKMSQ